jgi:hypothetical protein
MGYLFKSMHKLDALQEGFREMTAPLLSACKEKGWKVSLAIHVVKPGDDGDTTVTDVLADGMDREELIRAGALLCFRGAEIRG